MELTSNLKINHDGSLHVTDNKLWQLLVRDVCDLLVYACIDKLLNILKSLIRLSRVI